MSSAAVPLEKLIITPRNGWQPVAIGELWRYRELLWILAMRDVRVRYKQTLLGVAWAIIPPFMSMIVFTVFFHNIGKMPTDDLPPPVFYFCGMVPWQLFTNALTQAGNSLISNQNLVTKVYFPRLVIPISAVITGLIDFVIAFFALLLVMLWYHVIPSANIIFVPVFLILTMAAALAVGLLLSALNVEYRDVRYVIPFLTQFWFFPTPILYTALQLKHPWARALMGLNPVAGPIEGFRWCMTGKPAAWSTIGISTVSIAIILTGGVLYFRRIEKSFADVI